SYIRSLCALYSRFNRPAPTAISPLSLHDALPIYLRHVLGKDWGEGLPFDASSAGGRPGEGAAALVLKREADALRDGDRIYAVVRSEEHTSELQSRENLVCRLLLEKKKKNIEQHDS